MTRTTHLAWLAPFVIAIALPIAAEEAPQTPSARDAPTANDDTKGAEDVDPDMQADAEPDAKPPSSPEVFVPSEAISEDLAVSFPVDI